MRCASGLTSARTFLGIVSVLVCWLSAFPIFANAQSSQGQDAVYNSTGIIVGSSSFIDAGMFASSPPQRNICAVLNWVLNPSHGIVPTNGAVIDARGIPGITPLVSMTCTASPWAGIAIPPPSTMLLPAGTIAIPGTWVLPNNTHLIGEGDALNPPRATPVASGTILQANFSSGDMIDLGSSSVCPLVGGIATCNSVSVEHLILDGQGHTINGIVNSNAQDGSYVDHVSLYQIRGKGLLVQTNATNSGPYSNITFDTGGYASIGSTVCAQILNVSGGTHGLRQLSCTSESNDALARVAHSFPVAA